MNLPKGDSPALHAASGSDMPHEHSWKIPDGPVLVIATYPEQRPYVCECGAFTHDPDSGRPCQTCAPEDYARRGPTITLRGGQLDGKTITLPVNQSVYLRVDSPERRVQMIVKYERSESDPGVWEFKGNNWTHPVDEREAVA